MRTFVLLLFCTLFFAEFYSQDSLVDTSEQVVQYDSQENLAPVPFSEEKIEEFNKEDDFNYDETIQEEGWWAKFKSWLSKIWRSFWNWLLGDYEASGFWSFIIGLLPYILIATVVGFIIWLFYKLNPGARLLKSQEKPGIFFTEEEEIVKTKDIRKLITKALEKQNYRLAVRYYYLLILKKLSDADVIEYMFDKTNNDYISEITAEQMNLQFQKATSLYDYIWYGNFDVTATDYEVAQETFLQLEQQIPNTNE